MTFCVRVNGEEVWSTDLQVDQVSLQSAKGEAGRIGVSYDTNVIDVVVAEVAAGGPVRLDHIEARDREVQRNNREGEIAVALTTDRYDAPDSMQGTQGDHDYTARPGGGDNEPHVPSPEENAAAPLAAGASNNEINEQQVGEDNPTATSGDSFASGAAVEDADTDGNTQVGPGTENPGSFVGGFDSNTGTSADATPTTSTSPTE